MASPETDQPGQCYRKHISPFRGFETLRRPGFVGHLLNRCPRINPSAMIARRSFWLILAVCVTISASDSWAADHAVVLQYHHVDNKTPYSTSITPGQFEKHLAFLETNGFVVWSLERIVDSLKEGRELPENCVAITFDDAYESVFAEAYPRLRKRDWPFTVFVATEGVDRGYRSLMTWEQMRQMRDAKVVFANHSHTHPYMVRMAKGETPDQWRHRMQNEIETAGRRLREEVSSTSRLFAYPYGEYSLNLKRLVLAMGMVGVGQQSGVVWRHGDFGALPRFPMSGAYADMNSLKEKVYTLPLPVIHEDPEEPLLDKDQTRPTLKLTLGDGEFTLDSVTCFASGQGRILVRWVDRARRIFECRAASPLPVGRSRYNCTAPQTISRRYYWFSRQWLLAK